MKVTNTQRHHPSYKRLVVLISGTGSNLQAILDAIGNNLLKAQMVHVISNRATAAGLEKAHAAGVITSIAETDATLNDLLIEIAPDVIALAGFMRILSGNLVNHFSGRILNIHPSLLPKYKGLHTHRRVLASDDTSHGCSVHFVTENLDAGPVIMQSQLPIRKDDTLDTLALRVLKREHIIYPRVLSWYCEDRLQLQNGQCVLDGKTLDDPILLESDETQ